MKKIVPVLLALALPAGAYAQSERDPDGGGAYQPPASVCVPAAEQARINAMLQQNIALLKRQGKLPADWGTASARTAIKPTAGNFIWPLKQQPGFSYNSVYGISNFVDLNPLFPNQVQDWNCGMRSYDQASGYNHGGIDIFLWPFSQTMQEQEQVAIIAAASGIIIGKDDGYDDHSCAMSGGQWNAVYVGNADGTICWYGHMKKNAQTTKVTGEQVAQGEFLGFVGSSGNSTGPHLHFETHTSGGQVLEPYQGPCNPGQSLWASQKPYIEPTINAVMTHNHAPEFPDCPQLETLHNTDYFYTGDTVFFASYFHDQTNAQPVTYTILRPDNSVFDTWNNTLTSGHYTASYWYWYWKVAASWPSGTWTYRVTYEGNTVNHPFHINDQQTGIAPAQEYPGQLVISPNPGAGRYRIGGLKRQDMPCKYVITDVAGRMVANGIVDNEEGVLPGNFTGQGIYFLQLQRRNGQRATLKFLNR